MVVLLIRHAIADQRDAVRWPDDSQRPLTEDGVSRFRPAARGLATLVPSVDALLSSPYPRALRTAELLREEAGWTEPEPCSVLEADRDPEEALPLLSAGAGVIALVGHEPMLSFLASLLLTGKPDAVNVRLKKGGAIAVELDGVGGSATLLWSLPPRMLRKLDPGTA